MGRRLGRRVGCGFGCWGYGGGDWDHRALLELFDHGLDQLGGDGVGFDSACSGDVEADGFAVEVHEGAAAVCGLEDGVVLEDGGEAAAAVGEFAAEAVL